MGYITVDDIDYAWAASKFWEISGNGYARRTRDHGKRGEQSYRMHRLILEQMLGLPLLPTEFVDHKHGNKLDNRRRNLRIATKSQNGMNRHSQAGSISPFNGVCYDRKPGLNKRWMPYITYDGKRFYLGRYWTEEEAAWMRDQWALALYGEFARLNFEYLPVACDPHFDPRTDEPIRTATDTCG